jgi:dCMP deaminase
MADPIKMDKLYMDIAYRVSQMSHDERMKVGGVLVNNGNIISFGWNGMPSGFDNNCQDENNVTKPQVLHAEQNIYSKLARNGGLAYGSTLYITMSPCYECSKLIIQSGTQRVVYHTEYRNDNPIFFLEDAGVNIEQIENYEWSY